MASNILKRFIYPGESLRELVLRFIGPQIHRTVRVRRRREGATGDGVLAEDCEFLASLEVTVGGIMAVRVPLAKDRSFPGARQRLLVPGPALILG